MAKKTPPIKLDSGIVPIVTANPNTTVDGVLKLASVGATIIASKIFLNGIDDDHIIAFLQQNPEMLPAKVGTTTVFNVGGVQIGYDNPQFWTDLSNYFAGIDFTNVGPRGEMIRKTLLALDLAKAKAQVIIDANDPAALALAITNAQSRLTMWESDIVSMRQMRDGFTPGTSMWSMYDDQLPLLERERVAAAAALQAAIEYKTTSEQQQAFAKAIVELKGLTATQGRWVLAIVGGTLIATTMIYAGDSVLDLMSNIFSSIFGLTKVMPA